MEKIRIPGTWNNGRINRFNKRPKKSTTGVWLNKSVAIKKGKSDGTTELAHKLSPFFAAEILEVENKIRPKVNSTNIIDKIFFFVDKMKILKKCFFLMVSIYLEMYRNMTYNRIKNLKKSIALINEYDIIKQS